MKQSFVRVILIVAILLLNYSLSFNLKEDILKLNAKAKDKSDMISDKELDELLKDPKYASMASELLGKDAANNLISASSTSTTSANKKDTKSKASKCKYKK